MRTNTIIKYASFLRAINAGDKNLIKMNEMKKIFESVLCKNVSTYIQSGNVMFESSIADENVLTEKIENRLHKNLCDDVLIYIRTVDKLKSIVEDDPKQKINFNIPSKLYFSFLKKELEQKPKSPFQSVKKDVEIVRIRNREIYCFTQEIKGRYGFPELFIEKEFGVKANTRNWNSIIKFMNLNN